MTARVQVVIEAKDNTGGVLGAITNQFGGLGAMAQKAGRVLADSFQEALRVTQEYGKQVRDLSLASGTGAEATSRFIQVLDDYELSAADALAATRFLTKQGLEPTIDTLANLSDEYLSLNDAQAKNEFILKNLGRSGLKWSNVLKEGGDALRAQGAAVSANLILNDQQVLKLEEVRLAQDAWNDAIMGTQVQLITGLLPALDAFDNSEKELALSLGLTGREADRFAMSILSMKNETNSATQSYQAMAEEFQTTTIPVMEELTEITNEQSAANQGLLSLVTSLQGETDRYKSTAAELHEQQDLLRADYVEGTVNAEEYKAKMGELTSAVKENQKAHVDAGNKIMFSLMQQKLAIDGLSDVEMAALEQMGVAWGIFDQQTVNAAHTMMNTAGIMDEQLGNINDAFKDPISKMTQANEKLHALQNMSGQMWTYYVNIETSGSFPNLPGPNNNQSGPGTNAGIGYQSGQQSGGTVYAGRPYMVGEGGAEPFVPSQNGRVLGHAESLHALTVGGGGGNTNYFYGPVTLELGADAGGGLMGIRM